MGQTFYSLIDREAVGKVDFEMFCNAIQRDKELLDFFSLVLTGMSDGFIQKNIERMKLETLINRIGSIQQEVLQIKELMEHLTKNVPEIVEYKKTRLKGFASTKKSIIMAELQTIGLHSRKIAPISKPIRPKVIDDDMPSHPSSRNIDKIAFNSMPGSIIEIDEINAPAHNKRRLDAGNDRQQPSIDNRLILPIFEGDSEIIEDDDIESDLKHQEMTKLADNMMKTPKMVNYVNGQFLRKTNTAVVENSDDTSLALQILAKIDLVFNRMEAFKDNLADSQEKLKNQIGTRISSHVKKNMGASMQKKVSGPKNKLLFILHDNWSIMASMMMGIQKSTSALQNDIVGLTDRDFKLQYKFELRPAQISSAGNELEAYSKSIFYDYAPYVFKEIRQLSNISSKTVYFFHSVSKFTGH